MTEATTPEAGMRLEPFERYPALASWIAKMAASYTGLSLGEWMTFVGALNAAIVAAEAAAPVPPAGGEGEVVPLAFASRPITPRGLPFGVDVNTPKITLDEARKRAGDAYEVHALILAARAQPPVGEVVAWLFTGPDDELVTGLEMGLDDPDRKAGWTAQPLFAHPAEPAARDGGEAERVFTVSPSGGGWPVTIIPSKVESFNAKGCNSDERRVVMVSGESYRLRLGDADAIMAALAAGGEK